MMILSNLYLEPLQKLKITLHIQTLQLLLIGLRIMESLQSRIRDRVVAATPILQLEQLRVQS